MSTRLLGRPRPASATAPPPLDRAAVQRRTLRTLVVVQVVGGAGLSAGATVVALVAVDLSGSTAAAGLPHAASVAGTAAAAVPLAAVMRHRGRRPGLRTGWWLGALGAVGVVAATAAGSLLAFVASMVLLGCAGAASDAARHVAADLAPSQEAGRAIGTVVAATAVSTATAPLLTGPLSVLAGRVGLPPLSGPFLLSVIAFATAGMAASVLLRPDPLRLARHLGEDDPAARAAWPETPTTPTTVEVPTPSSTVPTRILLRRPAVLLALVSAATVNASMVAMMSMTPVHMAAGQAGHGAHLDVVGTVVSLHIAAMFAPSPLTGRLVDRHGARRVVAVGAVLVGMSGFGALLAGPADVGLVTTSVVLLGLGWNASFVAGSSLLAAAAAPADRPRIQGVVDATAGVTAMLAGLLAGVVTSTVGYGGIGLAVVVAAALLAATAWRPLQRTVGDRSSRRPEARPAA